VDRLKGKVAIVTGAANGIGRATAKLFVHEGARVVLADRDRAVIDVARAPGDDVAAGIVADVSSEVDTIAIVNRALERFDGVDILFANAGIEGTVAPLASQTVEDFDRLMAINVRGTFLGIKHAAPRMAARGGGSIVVTSSIAGVIGSAGLGPYVASKHAVIGLVKTAALELAPLGVRVNTVNPGPIENRMMRSIEEQAAPGAAAAVKEKFLGMVPLHRYGTNEEIARLVLFLASDEASYCTGNVYVADGGFVAS
jgi:NAD(P)-dependent dehydrogenase (short-subunit alcohol dehydrogenase family)